MIIVILMISIIIAVTLELNRSSRSSIHESANLADQIRLKYIAKSGFNLGVAVLLDDKNPGFDALNEDWAVPEMMATQAADLFDKESLQVTIADESGKIPINKLVTGNAYNVSVKDILVRLLKQPEIGLEAQKAEAVVDSIKDWIDADDETTGDGAESGYYKSLDKSYPSKNKLLDCIDEILMIKGVTGELYNGSKDAPGIKMFLTVYGDGKININTAPKPVLRALFDIPADTADQLDAYRKEEGRDLAGPDWVRNIPGMRDVMINSAFITTKSNDFEISAVSRLNKMKGQASGVIRRKIGDRNVMELLSWKVE